MIFQSAASRKGVKEMINWNVSKDDGGVIRKLAKRAYPREALKRQNTEMDLMACHNNGCPLDLKRMLAADDFNFWHDVNGIARHLDHDSGELTDCFLPRFSKPSAVEV